MALIPAGSNQKPYFYEYASDADLVASVLPYASLTTLSAQGFGAAKGYVLTGSDSANNLPPCFIYSRNGDGTAGRYWVVTQGSSSKCLVLISEGSAGGSTSSGADIVRVVAKSSTYITPALSSAVYSTIVSALSGAPSNAAILILNDSYTESPTITSPVALIGFGDSSQLTISGTITTNSAIVLRNLTVAGGAGSALVSTAGDVTAYDCSFTSSTASINSAAAGNIVRLTQCTANDVSVDTMILVHSTLSGSSTAAVSITAVDSSIATLSAPRFTGRRTAVTGTLTISAGTGPIVLLDCAMAGLTSSSTAASTVRNTTFSGATTLAGACTADGTEFAAFSGTSLTANSTNFTTLSLSSIATLEQGRATGAVSIAGAATLDSFVAQVGSTFGSSLVARASNFVGALSVTGAATLKTCNCFSTSTFSNLVQASNTSFVDTVTKNGAIPTFFASCALEANAVIDAQSALTLDNTRIGTSLSCGPVTARGSSVGTTSTIAGSVTAWNTIFGTTLSVSSGTTSLYNCTVTGASSHQYMNIAAFTSFLSTVTLVNPDGSPFPHTFVQCYLRTGSGNAVVTSSANDTVTFTGGSSNAATNILISGNGSARVIGSMAGGNRITTSLVADSRSLEYVHGKLVANLAANNTVVTLAGGATAPVPDLMLITPTGGVFDLTMYPGSDLPDGYVAVYKNLSTTNSYQLVAGGTDTIESNATTLIGPGDSRRYVYSRSGTAATIYEIV